MEPFEKWMIGILAAMTLALLMLVGTLIHSYATGKRIPGNDSRNEVILEQK